MTRKASRRRSETRDYARHPGDILRVVLGALVVLATMLLVEPDRLGVRETDVCRLVNDLALPGWTYPGIWLVMQLGVIGAVPLVAGLALATKRLRLAFDAALAGGTIYVVAKLVKELVQRGRPAALLEDVHILGEPATGLGYVSGHAAIAVTLATVASPYLDQRWRRVAWLLAATACAARVYVGAHLPLDVVGGAALGWAAGALVHLALGAPTGRPSLGRVRDALETYGFGPADLEPRAGEGERSGRYYVTSRSHPDLFVKVVPKDRRDGDLLYRTWRRLIHRGDRRPAHLGDPVRHLEHEASMALMAAAGGVRTPRILLVRSFGKDAGLLVEERVPGRDLAEAGQLDEPLLVELWRQVALLHGNCIAHGDLGPASVLVDQERQPWLVDFDEAEAAATTERLDRDTARLLAALSGMTDPELLRTAARQALGPAPLERALALPAPGVGTPSRASTSAER